MQWAAQHGMRRGKPICIRYYSEYAARVATGTWKAKKHKGVAEEAKRAWAQLKQTSGGKAWMQHAPRTTLHALNAGGRARDGKAGAHVYAEIVT